MSEPLAVHLVDGTYELYRHFYGARRFNDGKDAPLGAVAGVLATALEMIEGGARRAMRQGLLVLNPDGAGPTAVTAP